MNSSSPHGIRVVSGIDAHRIRWHISPRGSSSGMRHPLTGAGDMVEQESKPDGGLSSVPPQQSAESGVFLRAIIPDVKSDASLPFGPGHSNQSGIFPGITGSTPEAIPPAVEPPESPGGSNGSTNQPIQRLRPRRPSPESCRIRAGRIQRRSPDRASRSPGPRPAIHVLHQYAFRMPITIIGSHS